MVTPAPPMARERQIFHCKALHSLWTRTSQLCRLCLRLVPSIWWTQRTAPRDGHARRPLHLLISLELTMHMYLPLGRLPRPPHPAVAGGPGAKRIIRRSHWMAPSNNRRSQVLRRIQKEQYLRTSSPNRIVSVTAAVKIQQQDPTEQLPKRRALGPAHVQDLDRGAVLMPIIAQMDPLMNLSRLCLKHRHGFLFITCLWPAPLLQARLLRPCQSIRPLPSRRVLRYHHELHLNPRRAPLRRQRYSVQVLPHSQSPKPSAEDPGPLGF